MLLPNLGDDSRPVLRTNARQENRSDMRISMYRIAAVVMGGLLLAAPAALAADPEFTGTWSLDPANCSAGQESENAPLVMAKDRYDQHESHCTFKSVEGGSGEWKIAAECTVEGGQMPYDFSLTLSGDTLTFADSGGPRDFLRCKP